VPISKHMLSLGGSFYKFQLKSCHYTNVGGEAADFGTIVREEET